METGSLAYLHPYRWNVHSSMNDHDQNHEKSCLFWWFSFQQWSQWQCNLPGAKPNLFNKQILFVFCFFEWIRLFCVSKKRTKLLKLSYNQWACDIQEHAHKSKGRLFFVSVLWFIFWLIRTCVYLTPPSLPGRMWHKVNFLNRVQMVWIQFSF